MRLLRGSCSFIQPPLITKKHRHMYTCISSLCHKLVNVFALTFTLWRTCGFLENSKQPVGFFGSKLKPDTYYIYIIMTYNGAFEVSEHCFISTQWYEADLHALGNRTQQNLFPGRPPPPSPQQQCNIVLWDSNVQTFLLHPHVHSKHVSTTELPPTRYMICHLHFFIKFLNWAGYKKRYDVARLSDIFTIFHLPLAPYSTCLDAALVLSQCSIYVEKQFQVNLLQSPS